jgi:DNA polymerase III psi subunit
MIDTRQQSYLDAMGIDVWTLRDSAPETLPVAEKVSAPRLKLGPGKGGTLLICAGADESAGKLANDISRLLGSVPVWAWPHSSESGPLLEDAVCERLFTTVAIFGHDLASRFFGTEPPVSLNTSRVVLLPGLSKLENSPDARKSLWLTMCRSGMVASN